MVILSAGVKPNDDLYNALRAAGHPSVWKAGDANICGKIVKAVQNGNVWCTAQSLFQQSMELPDLILDMNRVFTEGTPADSELTFLTHVE